MRNTALFRVPARNVCATLTTSSFFLGSTTTSQLLGQQNCYCAAADGAFRATGLHRSRRSLKREEKSSSKLSAEDKAERRQKDQSAKQQQQMRDAFPGEQARPLNRQQLEEMQDAARLEKEKAQLIYQREKAEYEKKNGEGSAKYGLPYRPPTPTDYEEPGRNLRVFSNTAKGMYIHFPNLFGAQAFIMNDLHVYFWGIALLFVGSQVFVRWKVAKRETAEQAKLGETLLDNRTRELLGDIENLRNKDPMRLEHEANVFHEQFWKNRAQAVSDARKERRQVEITRGEMQGVARGTDMSEWLGAKHKDEEEREIARRTHDYIQGFHQALKARRLL